MFKPLLMVGLLAASPVMAQPGAADRHHYPAGQAATVDFSLQERSPRGGRTTSIYRTYRPNVSFDGGPRVECVVAVPGGGGVAPGTTRRITLTCPVPLREGQTFEAFERDRPVGTGVVTAPL
ncbi:MAG: hypothetical protein ACK4FB_00795 [Brevundimonas sp.]|uniref:hypothetical protein n=1 Tax=Brevundimonas sp. TaxID=1871086 RepID=UPI00391A51B7